MGFVSRRQVSNRMDRTPPQVSAARRRSRWVGQTGMAFPNRWEAIGWVTPFGGLGGISARLS